MSHGPSSTETRHLRTLFAVGAAGMLSDGQLLQRFASRTGDTAELAFASLVERHGSMVLRVARGVCLDEHSTHDVFQATFLILARKARSLWVRDSLGPWLHAVAYRVASQGRAMELRRKRLEKAALKPEAHHQDQAERADLIRAIHQEIDRLPQPFRLAVVACHLEGLTQQDAADRLGWPVGTLQSRLARGRQKLRERLERRGLNPSLSVIGGTLPSVPHLLTTSTAKAAASLHLGRAIAGTIAPTVIAMIETSTQGMLMTKLKLGAAAVVMMVGGIVGSGMAVGVGSSGQKPESQLPSEPPRAEDSPIARQVDELPHVDETAALKGEPVHKLANPRPWQTVARINLPISNGKWAPVASGTVIKSTPGRTFVLTTARIFASQKLKITMSRTYPDEILVDLFDGPAAGEKPPASVPASSLKQRGRLIAQDFDLDLALIEIQPGRVVPVSPLARDRFQPERGTPMVTLGCSYGGDATVWATKLANAEVWRAGTPGMPGLSVMECDHELKPVRNGGGLFNAEGFLMGVALYDNPEKHTAFYARLESIRSFLDRARLTGCYPEDRADRNGEEAVAGEPPPIRSYEDVVANVSEAPTGRIMSPVPSSRTGTTNEEPAVVEPSAPRSKQASDPSLTDRTLPKPWETSVRVKVQHSATEWGYGAGTIIQSTETSAIILTSARVLRRRPGEALPLLTDYRSSIEINLFDEQHAPAIGRPPIDIHADLIDYNLATDLCLLRIQTDRRLPASPVVKPNRPFASRMMALGGLWGKDTTVWNTTAFVDLVPIEDDRDGLSAYAFKCPDRPDASRNGSGLYTLDGYLTGVCTRPDRDKSAAGYYIAPGDIHRFLDRNGMTSFYLPGFGTTFHSSTGLTPVDSPPLKTPQAGPASDDQRRIAELEKKLDQVLKALEGLKGEKRPE